MEKGLLLDVGVVLVKSAWELIDDFERARGLPPGTIPGRGMLDPDGDPDWQRHLAGETTELEYWMAFADRAVAAGAPLDGQPHFMRTLFHAPDLDQVRPQARALVHDAHAAGVRYGILTNELRTLQGDTWAGRFPEITMAEVLVDAADTGVRKPDPRAYAIAIEQMGLPAGAIVFVDDNPRYVEGGRAAGLHSVHLDVRDVDAAFVETRRLLGLAVSGGA